MDAVSGIFLSALGTDMTAMEEYFPFLSKAFDVMQYTAWAMLFLITVWQLFKAFGGPITESEHPLQLIARSSIFAVLIAFAKPIFELTLDTHFHKEDEQFVKLVTEYHSDFQTFYQRFLLDQEKYKDYRVFDLKEVPSNVFDLSCLPWVHYRNFDMHIFDSGTYLAPVITWGKYSKSPDGRILMPLSMNIHHAAADGFHLCRFFSDTEYWMTQIT